MLPPLLVPSWCEARRAPRSAYLQRWRHQHLCLIWLIEIPLCRKKTSSPPTRMYAATHHGCGGQDMKRSQTKYASLHIVIHAHLELARTRIGALGAYHEGDELQQMPVVGSRISHGCSMPLVQVL